MDVMWTLGTHHHIHLKLVQGLGQGRVCSRYGPQYGPPSVSQSISRSVSIPSEGIPPSRAASGGIEIIYRGGNMVPGTRIVPPCGPMRELEIRNLKNEAS